MGLPPLQNPFRSIGLAQLGELISAPVTRQLNRFFP